MPARDYLPPDIQPADVRATVGLVSDTHMPERCRALPPPLFEALAGCDLLLHAGDVGELRVLEELSTLAPVVAVHGNDDSAEAQRVLPYETVLVAGGQRLFLWHSHHADPVEEAASRRGDAILPKLARSVARARRAGATLAVFGHWHIPLLVEIDGVTVVNPGAIASGNAITRRLIQNAAIVWLLADGGRRVLHLDLAAPAAPFDAAVAWEEGFARTLARYEQSILDPALAPLLQGAPLALRVRLRSLLTELAQPVWAGEQPLITLDALRAAVAAHFTAEERELLEGLRFDTEARRGNPENSIGEG